MVTVFVSSAGWSGISLAEWMWDYKNTKKYFSNLNYTVAGKLSKINFEHLPREQPTNCRYGIDNMLTGQHGKIDLLRADRAIALVGDRRSGKSIYIADHFMKPMGSTPWWYHYMFPSYG